MSYRSPIASLEHELETLEADLAALRALPPAKPRPARKISKKARGVTQRETHALQAQLKKIGKKIEERSAIVGVRELTPREVARGKWMRQIGSGCFVMAALALGMTIALAARHRVVWTETTCSFGEDEEGDWIASYEAGDGSRQRFGASRNRTDTARCWVPGPTGISHMGRFDKPARPGISLRERISGLGLVYAGIIAFLGGFVIVASWSDERKRRRREVEPDFFDSED